MKIFLPETAPAPHRIYARYLVESAFPLENAIAVMAGEQSSGTFLKVPGETPELKERYGARIEQIEDLGTVDGPSLPGAAAPKGVTAPIWNRAETVLSWPIENMGPSLPNLLATVAGNLFELQQFSALRLLDIHLPDEFREAYLGPQFGIAGTRKLTGVARLPIIGTIVKPSVGLTPLQTADLVRQLVEGGIDFIKDDELQCDGPHCRFQDRVEAVMPVILDHADRTGRKVMFAFNVTGEIDQMLQRHDLVAKAGGNCVMVSLNSVGLPGLVHLRRHCQLAIHAHRNGWGLFQRSPHIGLSYLAYQKFWRLAGADHMHVNGLRNKFCEDDASVLASARECLAPMFDGAGRGCEVMPVFSSGQTVRQAQTTWDALGTADLIHAAGGGLIAHPGGVAAGVRAMRQAWEAAIAGIPAEEHAVEHPELQQALAKYGQ
ncbi:MAG: ribulose-bisphosphate carboxylase large subunit family protein [Bryobacteraceae bacterium]|nr:ribulose-bisphosphate carboxylase large subunit family protein [Bryobacteraceae bacterium]